MCTKKKGEIPRFRGAACSCTGSPGHGAGVPEPGLGVPGSRGPGAQQPPQLRAQDAPTVWHRPLVAITPHLENLSRHRSAAGSEGLSLDMGKLRESSEGNPPEQPHPKARCRGSLDLWSSGIFSPQNYGKGGDLDGDDPIFGVPPLTSQQLFVGAHGADADLLVDDVHPAEAGIFGG